MPMPKEYTSHGKSNITMLANFFLFWQNQKFMKPATYFVFMLLCIETERQYRSWKVRGLGREGVWGKGVLPLLWLQEGKFGDDVEGVYMHSVNIEQKTFFSILFFPFDLTKCKYQSETSLERKRRNKNVNFFIFCCFSFLFSIQVSYLVFEWQVVSFDISLR